jgi:hypothetical protein
LQSLQDLADKATKASHDIRRREGWIPPEEVEAYRAVLRRIQEKTADPTPGTEAAILRSIHQVVSDLLGTPPAGGQVE